MRLKPEEFRQLMGLVEDAYEQGTPFLVYIADEDRGVCHGLDPDTIAELVHELLEIPGVKRAFISPIMSNVTIH